MDRTAISAAAFIVVALIVLAVIVMLVVNNAASPIDKEAGNTLEKTKCLTYDCDTGSPADELYSLCCGEQ